MAEISDPRRGGQSVQLRAKTPGIAGKVKVLKRLGKHGAGVTSSVEPVDGATANRAIPYDESHQLY